MPTTGCKQSDNIINNTNNNQINNGTVTGVYKTEILKIPEGYTIKINNITLGNGRIYALCTKEEYVDNGHSYLTEKAVLYSVDINGENENIISLDHLDYTYFKCIDFLPNGNIYVLCAANLIEISNMR